MASLSSVWVQIWCSFAVVTACVLRVGYTLDCQLAMPIFAALAQPTGCGVGLDLLVYH